VGSEEAFGRRGATVIHRPFSKASERHEGHGGGKVLIDFQ